MKPEALMPRRTRLEHTAPTKRVIVKVGTSTLCDAAGSPDPCYLAALAAQVAELAASGVECVIVSSGAIRAGLGRLTLPHLPKSLPIKQAAAAVGQHRLMQLYAEAFETRSCEVAQVLLTRDDFSNRRRYLHAANTLRALLRLAVVPVINENDTVAVDEIRVGDNDTLAARVAAMVEADLLILLSDIDGLYTADPSRDSSAALVARVRDLRSIARCVAPSRGELGTGGMKTKIDAARIALACGIPMVIAHGRRIGVIADAIAGKAGTYFEPAEKPLRARKRWLAGSATAGALTIHPQAVEQLTLHGKSLLAAGVLQVEGRFAPGDLVALRDTEGAVFARGVVACSDMRLDKIKGLRTDEIAAIFGKDVADGEVMHRDNLALIESFDDE